MRPNFEQIPGVSYLVGDAGIANAMADLPLLPPFDGRMLAFLNDVSRALMTDREAKAYPDVTTFAFFIRRASTEALKARFCREDGNVHLGRGLVFHIAPSNVPVNYAYSLAAGLLTGNANFVRVPSKDFPQVALIDRAIQKALDMPEHTAMRGYVCLARYGRAKEINDALSAVCDVRVIWGGDATIAELRKSPLGPRAGEITFADRFSVAVVDSDTYLEMDERAVARDFYNDTYLTDQNACTSPRMVVWLGKRREEAKARFWGALHALVKERYAFQPIQAVNKLTSGYLAASAADGVRVEPHEDNLLVLVRVPDASPRWMDMKDNSGYFFEYDCEDAGELRVLFDDTRCQTVACIGGKEALLPLLAAGVRGADRIVPVGRTMDFDLLWDGYNLYERLTRTVAIA